MLNDAENNIRQRDDLTIITEIIDKHASVLDLGCGSGDMLYYLKCKKAIYACGVEISQSKIIDCIKKGVSVIHNDLNDGLSDFSENSFDYVLLSQTLQTVKRPDELINDMIRVGGKCIVSFMNIGYIKARSQLFFQGKMPVTKDLPDYWYNTSNIHLATICDFRNLCKEKGLKITQQIPFGYKSKFLAKTFPNLFTPNCVFVIEKN